MSGILKLTQGKLPVEMAGSDPLLPTGWSCKNRCSILMKYPVFSPQYTFGYTGEKNLNTKDFGSIIIDTQHISSQVIELIYMG